MNIKQFKIGDNLYKHGSFVGAIKYKITSISENSMDLECLSCVGHENCKLSVRFSRGKIIFNSMLNNSNESHWHSSIEPKSMYFYPTYKEYAHGVSAISIGNSISKIKKLEKELAGELKQKESYINWLKELDVKGYNY